MTQGEPKKKYLSVYHVYGHGKLKGNGQKSTGVGGFNSYRPVVATFWKIVFEELTKGFDVELPHQFGTLGVRKKRLGPAKPYKTFLLWSRVTPVGSYHPRKFKRNIIRPVEKYKMGWEEAMKNGQEYETYDRRTAIKIK